VSVAEPSSSPSSDTALLVCGGGCPKWPDAEVAIIMDQFITPTHPDQTITPYAVTTPSEGWPITGLLRLMAFAFGDPRIGGPGGAGWPDEPLWKLSGLFDLTADQSVQAGVTDLEAAMAKYGNDHLVIYGYSMGANTVNKEKRRLAAQYPSGTTAPDIDFVLGGDPNVPNGGLAARFPGLNTVVLGTFDGPEPTDTQFHTDVIIRQYDGAADFPLYPLNIIADLNAVLGFVYIHTHPFDVSLPADPTTSPAYQGTHGDSSYYFFPTQDLPLFAPLRQLGVPESLIDVVEPFFRVLVELGYDRSIKPWDPTPARLIPQFDLGKAAADLIRAIGDGVNNAAALIGLPHRVSMTAPVSAPVLADPTPTGGIFNPVTPGATPTQALRAKSRRAAIGAPAMSSDSAATTTDATSVDASRGARIEPVARTASDAERAKPPKKLIGIINTVSTAGVSTASRAMTVSQRPTRPVVRDSLAGGPRHVLRDGPAR
jgi:hypothetical protein